MTYDREGLSNPLYAEDIINNLEHKVEILNARIFLLEQKLEDAIISKEETYLMYYQASEKIQGLQNMIEFMKKGVIV
jgi:hypothetical protein